MDSLKEITLELTPEARLDIIDVSEQLLEQHGDTFARYDKALYCSYHTTAGYLEQRLCSQLNHNPDSLQAFVQSFQELFPPDADYQHDQLHLRKELSEAQRRIEPLNADSHLTFIGSGLENCVTYLNEPDTPVYFIDLDGVNGTTRRRRHTTVIGFDEEQMVETLPFTIPVSSHRIDSVDLRDPELGLFDHLNELIQDHSIAKGRIDISLAPEEQHASLTVNEYETLLMRYDLVEVLRNPLQFMAEKGRNMLRNPRAVPSKVKNYAKYDLVRLVNEAIESLGLSESLIERVIDKFIAHSASRRLRMKRSVSLMINNTDANGRGSIVQGTYQSPILVQWRKPSERARKLHIRLVGFE